MNDNIEFDVIVNGKKANIEIKKVEKSQEDLEKTTIKTNSTMSSSWLKVGASIGVLGASMGVLAKQGYENQKSMFGLTKATQDYIKQASIQHGMNENMIAGFVRTGQSAGMTTNEIKKMIDMAVALGRMYPHESTETFIDNLSMLNRTGEAQGYIVDVLEQKWGTIDLKSKSLAEKMAVIEEKTKGVNDEFNKTSASKIDTLFQRIATASSSFGSALLDIANRWGWLDEANKKLSEISLKMKSITDYSLEDAKTAKQLQKEKIAQLEAERNMEDTILGVKIKRGEASKKAYDLEIAQAKQRLEAINEQMLKMEQLEEKTQKENELKKKEEERLRKAEEERLKSIEKIKKAKEEEAKETERTNQIILDGLQRNIEAEGDYLTRMIDANKEKKRQSKEISETAKDVEKSLDSAFGSGLADMLMSGKASFGDFADSIIRDIGRIIIKKQLAGLTDTLSSGITSGLGSILGGFLGFAKGGVPTTRMAQGGIVNSPTKMRFAQGGMGLVGERNKAEGILPLTRTANGDLGVTAKLGNSGSQITSDVQITINAIDTQTGVTFLLANRDTIEGIVNNSLSQNGTIRANL